MGLFTYVVGNFHCLRCCAESEGKIQTKLFKVDSRNSAKYYFAGDSEEIEPGRLDDYAPLYNWNSNDDLVVVLSGGCTHCFAWQFAKVTIDISYSGMGCMVGSIESISTFTPRQVEDFAEVHRLDVDFVFHSGFRTRQDWLDTPIEVRCVRMLHWCYEVTGAKFTG